MTEAALRAEAKSPEHLKSHYPHNKFCEICARAHKRQKRCRRRVARDDDGLPAPTAPGQQLSTDTVTVAKSLSLIHI